MKIYHVYYLDDLLFNCSTEKIAERERLAWLTGMDYTPEEYAGTASDTYITEMDVVSE